MENVGDLNLIEKLRKTPLSVYLSLSTVVGLFRSKVRCPRRHAEDEQSFGTSGTLTCKCSNDFMNSTWKIVTIATFEHKITFKMWFFSNKKTIRIKRTISKQKTRSVRKCHIKSWQQLRSPYKPSSHIMLPWHKPHLLLTGEFIPPVILTCSPDPHNLLPCWDIKHTCFHSSTLHASQMQA